MNNYIRDSIHVAFHVAQASKLPILFMSNPGLGKSTDVELWARDNGYEVTTLVGSQRVREEILGYMINANGKSQTLKPDWYDEIMDNTANKKPTVLFIDELSTAPEDVQAALLYLIFNRKIGGRNNYLPDDCLIISAANYKPNLPPQMNIMSPTLNRFLIVNLEEPDCSSLIAEFMQDTDDLGKDLIKADNISITAEIKTQIGKDLSDSFSRIFNSYNLVTEEKENLISVRDKEFDGIYDTGGAVYNFISGRTLSFTKRLTIALYQLGFCEKILDGNKQFKNMIANMLYGLIGAGTGNFTDAGGKKFRKEISDAYLKILAQLTGKVVKRKEVKLNYDNMTVGQAISEWQLNNENPNTDNFDTNFLDLYKKVCAEYDLGPEQMITKVEQLAAPGHNVIEFMGDMTKLDNMMLQLTECEMPGLAPFIAKFSEIQELWHCYRTQALMIGKE